MSVHETQAAHSQTAARTALVLVFVIVAALAVLWPSMNPGSGGPDTLSDSEIESAGYDDAAARLMAGVWDSSFGPTVVTVDGEVERAPGSSDGDVTLGADHSQIEVDARAERTASAADRAEVIGDSVPMTADGAASVTRLISQQRQVEATATAGAPGQDIVAMTVTVRTITGQVTESRQHEVAATLRVTQEYRDGVVTEGDETAIVTFDAGTGKVVSVKLLTEEDLAR